MSDLDRLQRRHRDEIWDALYRHNHPETNMTTPNKRQFMSKAEERRAAHQSQEESGRPPIDAPRSEHRRWFNDKIVQLQAAYYHMTERVTNEQEELKAQEVHSKLWDELTEAYMDGNEAERKTLTFKENEFVVPFEDTLNISIRDDEEYPERYKLVVSDAKTGRVHLLIYRVTSDFLGVCRNLIYDLGL